MIPSPRPAACRAFQAPLPLSLSTAIAISSSFAVSVTRLHLRPASRFSIARHHRHRATTPHLVPVSVPVTVASDDRLSLDGHVDSGHFTTDGHDALEHQTGQLTDQYQQQYQHHHQQQQKPLIPPPLLISNTSSSSSTQQTIHVATARALTPMRRPRDDPLSSFNTEGDASQSMPSQRRTDLMAPSQTGVWALVPYVAAVAVLAGLSWIGKKRFTARQERLVEEFGEVMVLYGTSPDSRVEIASEYKRKLGPGLLRGAMFASFMHCLISEKAIVPGTIADVSSVKRLLKLSDARAITAINQLASQLQEAPSLLGKLLFIAKRIVQPSDVKVLASLNIVPLFPYSSDTVEDLQRNMLDRCYKEHCEEQIEAHDIDSPPLEAAAILHLDQRDAETLFDTVVAQRAHRKEQELSRIAAEAEAAEIVAKQDDVAELDSPARSGEPAKPNVHAYQCSDCGYTLFPAAGREFKFYGDDFVCPACGAPKDKFVDLNAEE